MENLVKRKFFLLVGCAAILVMASCAQVANASSSTTTSAPVSVAPSFTPTTEIIPAEPPKPELEFSDVNSNDFKQDKSVLGGDTYNENFFERPFTTDMTYLPDVDILKAAIATDVHFLYFTIKLSGVNTVTGDLRANYGIEVDVDKDGRGDYSAWVANPTSTSWTTTGVTILYDSNNDVGGKNPAIGETGWSGDGYDTTIPDSNPVTVWARVSPTDPKVVQFAVYRNLLGEPTQFLWGAWADNGLKNPRQFDYDDFYTLKQAGSGYAENSNYSLKTVNSNDNTCRQPYGFTTNEKIPNMCLYISLAAPTQKGPAPICQQFPGSACPAGCVVNVDGKCVPAP